MMKRKLLFLVTAACLFLTGCGYSKPESHSMMGLNISSITTICGTECTMDDISISSDGEHATATYKYTDVAGNKGISDAKTYHDYLKSLSSCVRIDDFDETKGEFCAYFRVTEKIDEGFLMKVSFTKNSYSVYIEDNAWIFQSDKKSN